MGVDLGSLVPVEPTDLHAFKGRVVAIDGYNVLYQFISSIRGPDGTPLQDKSGRTTSHLAGFLYRFANIVEAGVLPVVVWDGVPPEAKAATLAKRRERREEAQKAMEAALEAGDLATARTKAVQATRLEPHMVPGADRLLTALGVPTIHAPAEGEAQAVTMVRQGHAHAVASQDYDALMFGAPTLIRNLTTSGRRKVPGRQAWVDVVPERLTLDGTLSALELSHAQLVLMGVLVGTDYWPGVKGIGPKKALALIKRLGTVDAIAQKVDADPDLLRDVMALFLEAETDKALAPKWVPARPDDAVALLVGEHDFDEARVRGAVARYAKLAQPTRQQSLFDF